MQAPNVIDDVPMSHQIKRAYDLWSICYDQVAAPWEHGPRLRGLELAQIRPGDDVLDVGVGTGAVALRMQTMMHAMGLVCGIDVSRRMLAKSKRRFTTAAVPAPRLASADARALPFGGATFDVVYSAYTLDLLTIADVQVALSEFWRVLRPQGRLVLVNMSKGDSTKTAWFERLYRALPTAGQAYILGGCRPVVLAGLVKEAGFEHVSREFFRNLISSEIVRARRPAE